MMTKGEGFESGAIHLEWMPELHVCVGGEVWGPGVLSTRPLLHHSHLQQTPPNVCNMAVM